MFQRFLLMISLVAISAHIQIAIAEDAASIPDANCATSKQDKYEGAARFTKRSKQLSGQCLDTKRYRPARNVTMNDSTITFNNYIYKAQFWKAEVPNKQDAIQSVMFHIKRFDVVKGVKAAHTQLRFQFKKDFPIQLTNQVTGEKATTNDLLITYEATLTQGASYNFALGAMPNYALVARVGDTLSIATEKKGTAIEQYELALNPEETIELLRNNIKRSEIIAQKTFYNTLRPNCTSEVFDQIDNLPRFKGKFARFLTMISNDPVAGPAIDALKARGILKSRIQNFDDELAGRLNSNIPIEESKFEAPSFLPIVPDHPWTLVLVVPNLEKLPAADKEKLGSLKTKLLDKTLEFLQSYNATLMASDDTSLSSSQILSGALDAIKAEFVSSIKLINANMPSEVQTFAAYFVPMAVSSENSLLKKFGIEVAAPINVRVAVVDDQDPRSKDIFYYVSEGPLKASDVGIQAKDTPAYLMGLAIVVNAVKDQSSITIQALAGLNSIQKSFEKKNDQVEISLMGIPTSPSRAYRPTALLGYRQELNKPLNKELTLEFGPWGGIAGKLDSSRFGTFQVYKPNIGFLQASCETRAVSVPFLAGVLGPKPTKMELLNNALHGKKIGFQVTDAVLDVDRLAISNLIINVTTWPMDCVASSDVNNQFMMEANQAIKDFQGEQDLKAQAMRSLLSGVIGN